MMNNAIHTSQYTLATGHVAMVHQFSRPTVLSRMFFRGWAALKKWQNRRVAIRELSAMPDALLRDIGIERCQIKDAVHNFGKRPAVLRMPGESIAREPAVAEATRKAA